MNPHIYSLAFLCLISVHGFSQTWTAQSPQSAEDFYALTLADSLVVWSLGRNDDAGISDNYSRTTDQGSQWLPGFMGNPGLEVHAAHAFSPLHLLAVGKHDAIPESGFVAETFDGGLTWMIDKAFSQPLLGLHFADSLHGWMVGRNGYAALTLNGGVTWQSHSTPVSRDLHAVCFVDTMRGWAVGENGTLIHTRDGGLNWSPVQAGTSRDLYAVDFWGKAQGWIAGANGTLLATADSGQTWQAQNSGTGRDLHAVDFVSGIEGWVAGDNGTVMHSTDGGASWQAQASGTSRDILGLRMWSSQLGWFCGDHGTVHIYRGGTTALAPDLQGLAPAQVFPNPFLSGQDYLTVEVSLPAFLSISDLNGRALILPVFCPEGQTLINLERLGLKAGIYLYRLQAGPAILSRGKLLVQ